MSMGNSPADKYSKYDRLMAKADADRTLTARLAGRKSLFRRLLARLRPTGSNRLATCTALTAPWTILAIDFAKLSEKPRTELSWGG